jgi:hypothetical protein
VPRGPGPPRGARFQQAGGRSRAGGRPPTALCLQTLADCGRATRCVAVGNYVANGLGHNLAVRWHGKNWRRLTALNP